MGKIFKNIILMLLLFAIIIIMIGILFYDYIPTRVEIQKPNKYKAEKKVTKVLVTIKKEEDELFGKADDGTGNKPEVVLQAYNLDAYDLALYEQADLYVSGKSNPFADLPKLNADGTVNQETTGNMGSGVTRPNNSGTNSNTTGNSGNNINNNTTGNSGNNINTNTLTEVTDNTLLNSGNSK